MQNVQFRWCTVTEVFPGVVFCPLFCFKKFVLVTVKNTVTVRVRVQGSGFVFRTDNLNDIR